MSTKAEAQKRQQATLPPILRKERDSKALQIFRLKKANEESYELLCAEDKLYTFSAWQYHVLCALFSFGGDSYTTLLVNVNDRFGSALMRDDLKIFFKEMHDKELFNNFEAEKHPLIRSFVTGEVEASAESEGASDMQKVTTHSATDVIWKSRDLFNPTRYLKALQPGLSAARLLVYPLPFVVFAALVLLFQDAPVAAQEIASVGAGINIFTGIVLSFFTLNLLAAFTTAAVAFNFGGTVNAITVVWFYGFIPRLVVRYEDTDKFSRRQKLWFHAAPLLTRLGIFSLCVLLWYYGRPLQGTMPQFFSTVALMAGLSVMLSACPFYKSNGYYFFAEFLGEPDIRKKAFHALLNKYRKNAYTQIDSHILAGYALICVAFVVALSAAVIILLHHFLNMELGSKSLIAIAAVVFYVGARLTAKIREINENYDQRQQFERWRKRVTPKEVGAEPVDAIKKGKDKPGTAAYFVKRALLVALLLVLIFPYPYRASGRVMLMPVAQQPISSDIAGIVEEVYYDGGEFLKKGTVIARLSVKDQQAQLEIARGKLAEQMAYIEQLQAMPSEEDIVLAEERLEIARVQWTYSEAQCGRQKILYDAGAISLDTFASVQKICDVDKQKVSEAEAELVKVMAGPSPEQILTAETVLQTVQAQIALYQDQIERSTLKMPFDGTLAALNLKEKRGDFLERGIPFAEAEDGSAFKIILEASEADSTYLKTGAPVEIRLTAHPGKVFKGTVTAIDSNVGDRPYGKTVKVIATLDNQENALKSGMSGYAKVSGESLMVWQVLTRAIYRFITVEMWAWVP